MNNERRRKRDQITGQLQGIKTEIAFLKEDEQDAMDRVPDNLKEGENYSSMEDAVDGFNDAICSIDEAIESLKNI